MKEFLTAAELILRRYQKPLEVNDIVTKAMEENILKSKGKTPENTMRARLSEHIRTKGSNSIFMRVGKNKFALREGGFPEYLAEPFTKKTNEYVICIKQEKIDELGRFFGFSSNYKSYLEIFKNPKNIVCIKRNDANNDYTIKQLVSYVLIKNLKGEILSYIRGSYSTIKDRLLQGVLNIGFGGHVNQEDYNLFGITDGGTQNAAIREVHEELNQIKIADPKLIGVINDDSTLLGLNHFAFVFTTVVDDRIDLNSISSEKSINQLQFLTIHKLFERFSELEFWSQLLVKNVLQERPYKSKVKIKSKRSFRINFPLIIVGEIGSGKTEVAKLLARRLKAKFISSRDIVSELIKREDFGHDSRTDFQNQSYDFVQNYDGCKKIGDKILDVFKLHERIIVDGIRQLDTFDYIKENLPSTKLIYIDLPIDSSFSFYKRRSKREITIHEFREVRNHPVERDITFLKNRADLYIYNGSTFEDLINEMNSWLNETI